jgi:hypothetical protein
MPIHPNIRRCIYYRLTGMRCGSPAKTGKARCWHHEQIIERRTRIKVPYLKNSASLQQAVMDVIQGLLTRRIIHRDATAILYALQLAQSNLKVGGVRPTEEDEAEGSFIRQILEEVDTIEELEDDADILKSQADHAEFEEQRKLILEGTEKPKK